MICKHKNTNLCWFAFFVIFVLSALFNRIACLSCECHRGGVASSFWFEKCGVLICKDEIPPSPRVPLPHPRMSFFPSLEDFLGSKESCCLKITKITVKKIKNYYLHSLDRSTGPRSRFPLFWTFHDTSLRNRITRKTFASSSAIQENFVVFYMPCRTGFRDSPVHSSSWPVDIRTNCPDSFSTQYNFSPAGFFRGMKQKFPSVFYELDE